MSSQKCMLEFISTIQKNKLLTKFIKNILNYDKIEDYNYIFRMIDNDGTIIIDIYDNISENRFNRYIFNFCNGQNNFKCIKKSNVFVTEIYINSITNPMTNLQKLAYLFSLKKEEMIEYSKTFLGEEFCIILENKIK